MPAVWLHDCIDPADPQGRTYKQVAESIPFSIPLDTLVELDTGERLRVKQHIRDCNGTPLYVLGLTYSHPDTWPPGFPASALKVIDE